ncbi:MAG: hypothetical protein K2H86_06115, partial [Muribaculaceae bacterium]|nr:hypothetical protein [Muribaculaceae bacterium]
LVGDINDWSDPTFEEGQRYQLTDTDNDGIYTGSFEIPAQQCQFKIFTKQAGWTDSESYLGLPDSVNIWYLFKGDVDTMPIGTWPEGYGNNIFLSNWVGGTLNISVKLTETEGKYTSGSITLSSDTQPEFPKVPKNAYLIGEFNDYKTPKGDNLNGAFPLTRYTDDGTLPAYEGRATIPAGKASIAICYTDPESGKTVYVCPLGVTTELYSQAAGEPAINNYVTVSADEFNKETDHLTITNWTGGVLIVRFGLIENIMQLQWDAAPLNDFIVDNLYMILDTKAGKEVMPVNLNYYTFIEQPTKINSIIFSTENSTDPDPSTIWGVVKTEDNNCDGYHQYNLAKGGNPIILDFPELVTGYVYVNTYGRWVMTSFDKIPDYSDLEAIYLVGYMTNWENPSEANAEVYEQYKLEPAGNGIFRGSFLCPASESPYFRFYQVLSGWDGGASIGATLEDYENTPIVVNTDEWSASRFVIGGKGNWALSDWNEDRTVDFEINMASQVLSMIVRPSGINGVEVAPDSEAAYFTLQGVRVAQPTNGIYIKVTSKGSEKVYIR